MRRGRETTPQRERCAFWFCSCSLCRSFCFISQISAPFHLSWRFFKNNGFIYHFQPCPWPRQLQPGSLQLPTFPCCSSLLFKSIYKHTTRSTPHFGSSVPPFPSTKLPVFTLNAIKLFSHLKKNDIVSFLGWEKKIFWRAESHCWCFKIQGSDPSE